MKREISGRYYLPKLGKRRPGTRQANSLERPPGSPFGASVRQAGLSLPIALAAQSGQCWQALGDEGGSYFLTFGNSWYFISN